MIGLTLSHVHELVSTRLRELGIVLYYLSVGGERGCLHLFEQEDSARKRVHAGEGEVYALVYLEPLGSATG